MPDTGISKKRARIRQLEEKNRELHYQLQQKILHSAHCSDFMAEMADKLEALECPFHGKETSCHCELLHLASLLRHKVHDSFWSEFRERFTYLNEGFYDRLLYRYPLLTETDLKLCAFIRMRLSSKEIARVINRPPGSVKVSRSRLRKKLGLHGSTEPLLNFMARQ